MDEHMELLVELMRKTIGKRHKTYRSESSQVN